MKRSRTLSERLATLLDGLLSKRIGDVRHTRDCRYGMWIDGYSAPDGAPCSTRCAETRAVRALLDGQTDLSGLPLFATEPAA